MRGLALWLAIALTWAAPLSGFAQATAATSASDMKCARDEGPRAASAVAPAPRGATDLRCAVLPLEAMSWIDSADTVFVDVRSPADYAAYGLRGAVNLALEDIPSKRFLKSKRVVLVGDGKGEQALYQTCGRLKGEGFTSVRVLRGGLPLWHHAQLPLVGRPPIAASLAQLNPFEFWRESLFEDNVVLLGPGQHSLGELLGFSTTIDELSGEAVRAVIERRRKELKDAPMAAVVLATDRNAPLARWTQLQDSLWPVPLLLYAEGRPLMDAFMARQNAAWLAQARGPKKPPCGR